MYLFYSAATYHGHAFVTNKWTITFQFLGVWLTVRYRNQKDPRANPSAFLWMIRRYGLEAFSNMRWIGVLPLVCVLLMHALCVIVVSLVDSFAECLFRLLIALTVCILYVPSKKFGTLSILHQVWTTIKILNYWKRQGNKSSANEWYLSSTVLRLLVNF